MLANQILSLLCIYFLQRLLLLNDTHYQKLPENYQKLPENFENYVVNSAKLQDTKSTYRKQLHFFTLAMKYLNINYNERAKDYFWALSSVPSLYMPIFRPVPYYFDY